MDQKQILAHLTFQHAVRNPDVEDCWREGYEKGFDSDQLDDIDALNPYKKDSIEYQYFDEGLMAGLYKEQPRFAVNPTKAAQQTALADVQQATTAAKKPAPSLWEQTRNWIYATAYRLLGLGAAAIMAIVGYQLVDFAFI